jgi:hypothetical protein
MASKIIQGDVFEVLQGGAIPAGSIDAVVTSPPY